jgi:hypothetical protein
MEAGREVDMGENRGASEYSERNTMASHDRLLPRWEIDVRSGNRDRPYGGWCEVREDHDVEFDR